MITPQLKSIKAAKIHFEGYMKNILALLIKLIYNFRVKRHLLHD